jgi:hypothetical protein
MGTEVVAHREVATLVLAPRRGDVKVMRARPRRGQAEEVEVGRRGIGSEEIPEPYQRLHI